MSWARLAGKSLLDANRQPHRTAPRSTLDALGPASFFDRQTLWTLTVVRTELGHFGANERNAVGIGQGSALGFGSTSDGEAGVLNSAGARVTGGVGTG